MYDKQLKKQKGIVYTFVSLFLILTSLSSCVGKQVDVDRIEEDQEKCFSVSINMLRSHGVDTEDPSSSDPNTDIDEFREDYIEELRIILFRPGEATSFYNERFTKEEVQAKNIKIKMKAFTPFDMFVVANESFNTGWWGDHPLNFLDNSKFVDRETLQNAMVLPAYQNTPSDYNKFMMTAYYANVQFNSNWEGSGAITDPYKLDFTSYNKQQRPTLLGDRKSVELMRVAAKVEVVLKDIVEVDISKGLDKKEYKWILPYGFTTNEEFMVYVHNTPKRCTLFPKAKLTDPTTFEEVTGLYYYISPGGSGGFSFVLREENVVETQVIDENSVGGIITADYKVSFYVPEYLTSDQLAEDKRPRLSFKYSYDENYVEKEKEVFLPIQNGATPTHYDYIIKDLPVKADWNIYRNRVYRINLKLTGKDIIVL